MTVLLQNPLFHFIPFIIFWTKESTLPGFRKWELTCRRIIVEVYPFKPRELADIRNIGFFYESCSISYVSVSFRSVPCMKRVLCGIIERGSEKGYKNGSFSIGFVGLRCIVSSYDYISHDKRPFSALGEQPIYCNFRRRSRYF